MIRVVCPNCNAKYRFDESRLAGKPMIRATCQKCGGGIEISADADTDADPGPGTDPSTQEDSAPEEVKRDLLGHAV